MLGSLKSLFRANSKSVQQKHTSETAQRSSGLPAGMTPDDFNGLRLGGMVSLNMLSLKAFDSLNFDASWSGETQEIAAVGVVELGQGEQLARFYLENDTWIQASIANGKVFEYKLFDFLSSQHVSNLEFDGLINQPDSQTPSHPLGQQRFTLETDSETQDDLKRYQRVWGAENSEWSAPVVLEETVTRADGSGISHVMHHCMLYERHDQASERFEYILLSAEADELEGSYQLVTSLGIDISALIIEAH
ncbi:YjfK family protein [Halomonas qaidamensis]|uniref:YjfK family protein n=1 Tax=Halomonas qaidamensis TaxID=2866211 RepID=A0ABY6JR80_9GAMM|nr:YjfK family protein [Halomonas qaidamensis]UYV19511.1 YjfK family protein [Halomonas qaidamensis]